MKCSVISSGSWGTALASVLCDNQHQVTLWSRSEDYAEEMQNSRTNPRHLPGYTLPKSLLVTHKLEEALQGCELLVIATPSQFFRHILEKIKDSEVTVPHIVNVSKGIENDTLLSMSELCAEVLGQNIEYADLTGPSHAEEVIKRFPTAVVVASSNPELAKTTQNAFMNDYFRVYTTNDVTGAEMGGALKNIFAIAAGTIDGLGLGDNTKAALITRGIVEMARLGQALGGQSETFYGLSGIGDLIVTCASQHSRNRRVGELLGQGYNMQQISEKLGHSVAEGVRTTLSAWQLAQKNKIDTPIIEQAYKVLYEESAPSEAIRLLMTRDAKTESFQ